MIEFLLLLAELYRRATPVDTIPATSQATRDRMYFWVAAGELVLHTRSISLYYEV